MYKPIVDGKSTTYYNPNPAPKRDMDDHNLNLFPKEMLQESAMSIMTPESVMGQLIYLEAQSHFNHLNTNSFAAHKALDELYSGLGGFKDQIMELLLGYQAPLRLGKVDIKPISVIKQNLDLAQEVCTFAKSLGEWAEDNEWCALKNVADELEAVGVKCKYLFTLS